MDSLLIKNGEIISFGKEYKVISPDGKISVIINAGSVIEWSAALEGKELFSSSKIAMVLADGRVLGENEKIKRH